MLSARSSKGCFAAEADSLGPRGQVHLHYRDGLRGGVKGDTGTCHKIVRTKFCKPLTPPRIPPGGDFIRGFKERWSVCSVVHSRFACHCSQLSVVSLQLFAVKNGSIRCSVATGGRSAGGVGGLGGSSGAGGHCNRLQAARPASRGCWAAPPPSGTPARVSREHSAAPSAYPPATQN